jgi:hypothetical protein
MHPDTHAGVGPDLHNEWVGGIDAVVEVRLLGGGQSAEVDRGRTAPSDDGRREPGTPPQQQRYYHEEE